VKVRALTLVLMAAGATLAGWWWLGAPAEGPSPPGPVAAKPAPAAKASSDVVLSIAPGLKRTTALPAVETKVSPLMREIRAAGDLKPIFDRLRALGNPTAEEKYVLATLLERCAQVTDRKQTVVPYKIETQTREQFAASLPPRAPNREKRIAAYDIAMADHCKGLRSVETTQQEIRDMAKSAAAAGDPKAQARELVREIDELRRKANGDYDYMTTLRVSDEQVERFKRIVASGDPRALLEVIHLFSANTDVHLLGPDDAPISAMALYHAAALTACDLGDSCGPDSPMVAGACAFQGQCDAADYRDHVFFYQLAPGNTQQVMQYQQALLRVVRDGDWSFFTFSRAPKPGAVIYRTQ
jgi:hypothetical protein